MDFLLSKYGLIFTEFESIDRGGDMVWYLLNLTVLTEAPPRSILSNSVNIRPYLLSKKSITVLLYSEKIYRRSLVRFWPEVPPVFISLIINVSFLLSYWLKMYKMRCIRQINKYYFHFAPYFIEISILAFWRFVWQKRCTILMEMNVDIIQLWTFI